MNEDKSDRAGFIGGSDVAAILNVHPYRTALQVWAEKTGRLERPEPVNVAAIHWGNVLEAAVLDEWARMNDVSLIRRRILQHPRLPYLRGQPDAIALTFKTDVTTSPVVVEAKTAGIRQSPRWRPDNEPIAADSVPIEYYCQVQFYRWLMTFDYVHKYGEWRGAAIAVLIAGQDFRQYTLPCDLELWALFERILPRFWEDNVLAGVAPDPRPRDNAYLAELFAKVSAETLLADTETTVNAHRLAKLKASAKVLDGEIDTLEGAIKLAMGERQILVDARGEPIATWKEQTTRRIDTTELKAKYPALAKEMMKASTSRRFLLKLDGDE